MKESNINVLDKASKLMKYAEEQLGIVDSIELIAVTKSISVSLEAIYQTKLFEDTMKGILLNSFKGLNNK